MISPHIADAILALVAIDKNATDADRRRVAEALRDAHDTPAVVSYTAAGKRLGVTRQTVYNLVKRGLLKSVTGAGAKGRATGITQASIDEYLVGA